MWNVRRMDLLIVVVSVARVCVGKKGKRNGSEKKGRGGILFYRLRSKRPELNKREILLIPASWIRQPSAGPGMRFRERESREHHQPAGSQVHHVVVREVGVWASGAR